MATDRSKEFHPAFEEYCEAIWELREDEIDVIQARIADRLEVSRPAVSEMMRRMEHEGLIDIDGASITPHRRPACPWPNESFAGIASPSGSSPTCSGLSWAEAHDEAGKWEHVISAPVEAALDRVLGEPTTCPHGNPIPGADYHAPSSRPLAALDVGTEFTVSRIPEELEFTPGLLDFLEANSLQPGYSGVLTALSPDGTATVEIDGRHVGIGSFASERILVTN